MLESAVRKANTILRGTVDAVKVVKVAACDDTFEDDFVTVLNNPNPELLSLIDRSWVHKELRGCKADPNRNNVCSDRGFTGARNSRRHPKYLGITHSVLHDKSLDTKCRELFVGVTETLDILFGGKHPELYRDEERNSLWANEIHPKNRVEAIRLAMTNGKRNLLGVHRDDGNSDDPRYSYVVCISWWSWDAVRRYPLRESIITYGKSCADVHMAQRKRHKPLIEVLGSLWKAAEEKGPTGMTRRDRTIFPRGWVQRRAYDFAFVDKVIFYSLFASAIAMLYAKYPILRNNLLVCCAFIYNVGMSESPDHFWNICQELMSDPCAITGDVPFYDCSGHNFGHAFATEIFRRKKHSGNKEPEKKVAYPVQQRHIPAVNTPPTFEKSRQSIDSIATLAKELASFTSLGIGSVYHYYGKTTHHLIKECYGAGPLTAMHHVGVAACLKLFPQSFIEIAEVGTSTRTWTFLKWAFGYTDDDAFEEIGIMLRAVSVYRAIHHFSR